MEGPEIQWEKPELFRNRELDPGVRHMPCLDHSDRLARDPGAVCQIVG